MNAEAEKYYPRVTVKGNFVVVETMLYNQAKNMTIAKGMILLINLRKNIVFNILLILSVF